MVILGTFLMLFFLWPLFLGFRESRFTLFLILSWWIMILVVIGLVEAAV